MKRAIVALVLLAACQSREDELIAKAKSAAAGSLKDPSSAQFADVQKCPAEGMVTGTINGKNGFGAYGGSNHFVYDHGYVFTAESVGQDALLEAMDRCHGDKPGTSRGFLNNVVNGADPV